jgi:hypothetical protein
VFSREGVQSAVPCPYASRVWGTTEEREREREREREEEEATTCTSEKSREVGSDLTIPAWCVLVTAAVKQPSADHDYICMGLGM